MRSIRELLRNTLTAKAGVTAAAIVVVGAGAAVAAPGGVLSVDDDEDGDLIEIEVPADEDDDDLLERIESFCEEEDPDASFCTGPSEPDGEPGTPDDDDLDEDPADDDPADEDDEGASAFSAWVRSLPKDWGCVRGQLVSHAARQGPHSGAFEELDFETAAEAAEFLGLEGRCVEVAIARSGGDVDGDEGDDAEFDVQSEAGERERGRPDHAGPKEPKEPKAPKAPKAGAADTDRGGPPAHAQGNGKGGRGR